MRFFLFLLVALLGFMNTSHAAATEYDFSEPPFWMFSQGELSHLRQPQKEFYFSHLASALIKIPAIKKISKEELFEAADNAPAWNEIQKKLYDFCADKSAHETCSEIAALRSKTLEMFANQKLENRKATSSKAAVPSQKESSKIDESGPKSR